MTFALSSMQMQMYISETKFYMGSTSLPFNTRGSQEDSLLACVAK